MTLPFKTPKPFAKFLRHPPVRRGLTPLLMAAEEGHSEVVALLLKSGASLEATDHSGSCLSWGLEAAARWRVGKMSDDKLPFLVRNYLDETKWRDFFLMIVVSYMCWVVLIERIRYGHTWLTLSSRCVNDDAGADMSDEYDWRSCFFCDLSWWKDMNSVKADLPDWIDFT